VAALWRYSSLAALVASGALPVLAWGLDGRPPMVALAVVLLLLLLVRHRENIVRLWQGTEGKIGQRVQGSSGQVVK
jgi:glycerol-3-phosphate acyltransferase PlsY